MINILKLRQLEKEKKQQTQPGEAENASLPEDTMAELAAPAEIAKEAQPKIKKSQKKSGSGTAKKKKTAAPDENNNQPVPVSHAEQVETEPVAQTEQVENNPVMQTESAEAEPVPQAGSADIDPAELFRQNLIQQILKDESMISREEYLKEIGELPADDSDAGEIKPLPAPVQEMQPEPVKILPPEPVIQPKPEIKREVYSDQIPAETPKPAGIQKTSEFERAVDQKNIIGKDAIIQMVGFTIGNEYYGVDICKIKEINRMTEITKVPRAPEFIEGVINLRGSVIPVINLRTKVRMPKKEYNKDTRIIIVELSGKTIGFIVDGVREVLRIPESLLVPPPALAVGKRADYITHVAKLDDDLVILMDPERVLSNDEMTRLK